MWSFSEDQAATGAMWSYPQHAIRVVRPWSMGLLVFRVT